MPPSRDIIDRALRTPLGESAYGIVEKLVDAGFDAWWVGGCVRDMLLGRLPLDIDIGTNASPDTLVNIFDRCDDHAKEYGSIIIPFGGASYEVTTFREDDQESDGRHPESVTFGSREQDAGRRDITINAMYWNPISRDFYDPFAGEEDLHERLIRIIGEPGLRIRHDALRLLRVVRFRALIDGQYHPKTYAALRDHAAEIGSLSGTRQLQELEKMLQGPSPERALEDLWELGILKVFLPELHVCKGIAQPSDYHREGDVWEHMLLCTRSFTDEISPDVRLAALFHDCGKAVTFHLDERIRFNEHASISGDITDAILRKFQCASDRRKKIVWLIRHHMMMQAFSSMGIDRKAHWYHHPWFGELLQLFWVDISGTKPPDFTHFEHLLRDYDQFLDAHPAPPPVLLSGDEIMAILDCGPGKDIGDILDLLRQKQLAGEITSKAEALALVTALRDSGDH